MEDYEIEEVAKILTKWNPLGDDAKKLRISMATELKLST